jgi:hypothetical protein
MRNNLGWLACIAWLLLVGCKAPTQQDVYTYRNDVGPSIDLIMENEIENRKDPTCLVWLNGSRVREGAWGGDFYLEVRYEGAAQAGYLDIGPGETLTVTIDGQPQSFGGMGSVNTRRKTVAGTYVEFAIYKVNDEVFKKIGKAKEVTVRIQGRNRTIERDLQPANIEKFRRFVLTYMGF